MPVDGISYGSYTPIAPKQQEPAQADQKELAPKSDQNTTAQVSSSTSGNTVDVTV